MQPTGTSRLWFNGSTSHDTLPTERPMLVGSPDDPTFPFQAQLIEHSDGPYWPWTLTDFPQISITLFVSGSPPKARSLTPGISEGCNKVATVGVRSMKLTLNLLMMPTRLFNRS